ncbi:MAG: hypothetical protein FJ263_06440 [Planctomycetes bacterium]|nr:hypothetical protein [Planctomycetota bacterium]
MGLRGKMLFGLIAYFGGFATAIYYLSPAAANAASGKQSQSIQRKQPAGQAAKQSVNTEKYKAEAQQFKERINTVIAFAEEKAQQAVELYKAHAAAAEQNKNLQAAAD